MGHSRLREVAERVEACRGRGTLPVVVFDIDSTLYDTGPRNLRILEEFAEARRRSRPEIDALVERVRGTEIGWNVMDALRRAGCADQELLDDLGRFWGRRFFTDTFVVFDEPVPGAPGFVRDCHERGAFVYYLTGRHVGGMEVGTVQALVRDGFPWGIGRTLLHLKPDFETPDAAFKDEALRDIRSLGGEVIATFENEPGNANLFSRAFPGALGFLLETTHAPNPPPLAPGILRTPDLILPAAVPAPAARGSSSPS